MIQVKVIAMTKVSIIFLIREINKRTRIIIRRNLDLMMIKLEELRGMEGRNNKK